VGSEQRLGVVSFLNARPLVDGLEDQSGLRLFFDVPAALPALLFAGQVDAALVPVIDVLRYPGQLRVVSDACIGCDGPTLTVRVFSHVPPAQIRRLYADVHSHTSVALAQVLWHELYRQRLELVPLEADQAVPVGVEAVLVIGDKVVDRCWQTYRYDVDLGRLWLELTGLPFVFAVWAVRAEACGPAQADGGSGLCGLLGQARDRGVARAAQIAAAYGPAHGFSVELAVHYLTQCLRYRLDARAVEGIDQFARRSAALGLIPAPRVNWSQELARVLACSR
jgi:chorismate dehydratase